MNSLVSTGKSYPRTSIPIVVVCHNGFVCSVQIPVCMGSELCMMSRVSNGAYFSHRPGSDHSAIYRGTLEVALLDIPAELRDRVEELFLSQDVSSAMLERFGFEPNNITFVIF